MILVSSDRALRNRPTNSIAGMVWQLVLIVAVFALVGGAAWNATQGLARQGISSGFGFLDNTAGFDISQHLIEYSAVSSYGRAFLVGLTNTLVVSAIAIPIATILGFLVGIMRRSPNWLVNRVAGAYVEIFRNTPLLVQLLFWYNAVLASLPAKVTESVTLGNAFYLNRRGLSVPAALFESQFSFTAIAMIAAILVAAVVRHQAKRRQRATGQTFPIVLFSFIIILGLPSLVLGATTIFSGNSPISFDLPAPSRFSVVGGWQMLPEFAALLLGLTIYTAASIAEVVRSGLAAVEKGQYEAARALHLSSIRLLQLVVVPQAIRVIIPPLTNQYLNLVKNSSLAVAVGYPDLVQVFAGTVLNQTGQAVEIVLMTMGVYLTISLITSAAMNFYNRRVRLVER